MEIEPRPDILSVGQLTQRIKSTLERTFPRLWVRGEISNLKRHTSGHLYFTLKDEQAQISAVMWRSRVSSVRLSLADGMQVLVRGGLNVYPPRGSYQIDVDRIEPVGVGELQRRFEVLKGKLEEEGLFDPSRKRALPQYPERIGIVTSPTGAAIQDICSVLARRMPSVEAILLPVRVQGVGAAEEIAEGIRTMNQYGALDVLIVGRGGGSLEDLWAFNEEIVARAIAASRIPVVSAVGHEVDVTIADLVADLRAPTPTAAGELVVRDRTELLAVLGNMWYTLRRRTTELFRSERDRVARLAGSYALNRPRDLLKEFLQRIDEIDRALHLAVTHLSGRSTDRAMNLSQRLEALNPRGVLRRGYAIVHSGGGFRTRAKGVTDGEKARIEFLDGTVGATLEKPR